MSARGRCLNIMVVISIGRELILPRSIVSNSAGAMAVDLI